MVLEPSMVVQWSSFTTSITNSTFTITVTLKHVKPDVHQTGQCELHSLEASIDYYS
jgi:hypothetical protein